MPRQVDCVDLPHDEQGKLLVEPPLDTAVFFVRLPDGTRARGANGKLLVFAEKSNAQREAEEINKTLSEKYAETNEMLAEAGADPVDELYAVVVPPEPHVLERNKRPARRSSAQTRTDSLQAGIGEAAQKKLDEAAKKQKKAATGDTRTPLEETKQAQKTAEITGQGSAQQEQSR